MKESTKRNMILIIVIQFLTIIVLLIGTCSCMVYTPTPGPGEIAYIKWKAEQKAANDALLKYTQSPEYQKKYYGKNPLQHTDSPAANSVVGTSNDPFVGVRNSNNIPSSVSTQNYRITIR